MWPLEKCPAPWQPCFSSKRIIVTNLLTKFHEDWTINVASRVFTRKNAPPHGSHTNLPTKFHEDWTISVASRVLTRKIAPPPGRCFFMIWTIFELVRDINEANVLTKIHDDWTKIVTSRVFTRNTSPLPGSHLHEDWASNVTSTVFTIFKLSRGINGTNTINVASRVFTQQNVDDARRTTHDGRHTTDKRRSQKLTLRTLCSGELKKNRGDIPPHPISTGASEKHPVESTGREIQTG
ncbi:hypothetical protein DPMN_145480 [Dreissena polymorpha]|uniref:Uncharacterized protein n=1 Tax=Dreissena polymorpha TaxID=45954 RepID=A0A9D4IXJ6_DREPO|nr:hypothetical protein DPMN_145480 [Dreissena polymorpha]